MALDAPPWATEEEIEVHGRAFIACVFTSRRHFDHYLSTGSMALPSSDRRKAQLHADPLRMQRERLRSVVYKARRGIADSEKKLAEAREELARGGPFGWEVQDTIKKQSDRLAQFTTAQQRAALDLELYDLLHPRTTNCDRS